MATKLLKDISRETLAVTDMKNQKQVITLKAGDMIEFRSKGKRFRYSVPLAACYNLALIYTHQQLYAEKLVRYQEGRKLGKKMRKPRPLPRIFSPKLYDALRTF